MSRGPEFPAGSKKRGMARAVEIVDWMVQHSESLEQECPPSSVARDVLKTRASHFREVANVLRKECPR